MHRFRLASAAILLVAGSAAVAQQPPRPISRGDYLKSVDNRFAGIDTNHDGKISRDEMVAAQQRDLQTARARLQQQLTAKFRQLDTNKDGQLSLQEFLAVTPAIRTGETPDQMMQKLDTNHDGKISPDEFRVPEIAKFNKVDANHDGVATVDEQKAAAGQR